MVNLAHEEIVTISLCRLVDDLETVNTIYFGADLIHAEGFCAQKDENLSSIPATLSRTDSQPVLDLV